MRAKAAQCIERSLEYLFVKVKTYLNTDSPAYSDTVYSDTPLTVTLLACPK